MGGGKEHHHEGFNRPAPRWSESSEKPIHSQQETPPNAAQPDKPRFDRQVPTWTDVDKEQTPHNVEEQPSTLHQLMDEVLRHFNSQRVDPVSGDPYGLFDAVNDTLESTDIQASSIFNELIKETKIIPDDLSKYFDDVSGKTWDEFMLEMSKWIVGLEIERAYPKILEDEARRFDEPEKRKLRLIIDNTNQ